MGGGPLLLFALLSFVALCFSQPQANLVLVGNAYPSLVNGYQLAQTQIVFRHGDRTPEKLFPGEEKQWTEFCSLDGLASSPQLQVKNKQDNQEGGNPFMLFRAFYEGKSNAKASTCSLGVLTKLGMKQLFTLGQEFRKIYGSTTLANVQSLDSSRFYVRSTDVGRTIMSAKNFLTGMFQTVLPNKQDPPSDGLEIHLYDLSVETMFPSETLCPGVRPVTMQYFQDPYINQGVEDLKLQVLQILLNQSSPLFDVKNEWIVKEKTFQRLFFVESFYDILCSFLYNKTLIVQLLGNNIISKIAAQADKERAFIFSKPNFTRLLSGYFFQQLVDNMVQKITNNTYDALFFSAHDITLMPLVSTLTNGFAIEYPGYASFLTLELVTLNGEYYVRALYNNGYVPSPPFLPPKSSNQYFLVDWGTLCPGVRDQFYCPLKSVIQMGSNVSNYLSATCKNPSLMRRGVMDDGELIWPL
eukprot:TRINITY_DN3661_c0_g1_i1.p1 TRINITY_DN3661_c0_g1~~TRINITY_DN3661_c0_g1_i1.p1  ORF type:complete len:469 (-),score=132.97 TRINITY_DN3661_c0_g1_i1:70-1476(-)